MNIGLGRSTYVYMIADPLAVLEENEVHFGFSNAFTDPKSQFQDTLLNAMDVLVARLPAHLPSDIQKVGNLPASPPLLHEFYTTLTSNRSALCSSLS